MIDYFRVAIFQAFSSNQESFQWAIFLTYKILRKENKKTSLPAVFLY